MMTSSIPFTIGLVAAAAFTGLLAVYAFRFRTTPSAGPLGWMMLACSLYSLGYAFELASSTLQNMLFWSRVQYLGISFIPALWLLFILTYCGRETWLTPVTKAVLLSLSGLTLIFHWTNPLHHLYYARESVDNAGPFPVLAFVKGPWYWVHQAYTNFALLAGAILLLRQYLRSSPAYRPQTLLVLIGSIVPWGVYLIYLAGLSPLHMDLSPFGLAVAGPLFAWGILRFRLLDLVPIAKESVFAGMGDGAIVVDLQNRLADFNPAAEHLFPMLSRRAVGQPLREAMAGPEALDELLKEGGPPEVEIEVGRDESRRYYQARLSEVRTRTGKIRGKTILFTETTSQVLLLQKLQTLASVDDLTGAYNRRHFLDLGRNEAARAVRYGRALSVIILDLDHFKLVNDTWGHEAGDSVLKEASLVLKKGLRGSDFLGRHGGEEFAVLLPETPPDQAVLVAERLRTMIAQAPILIPGGMSVTLTASFGVSGKERLTEETINFLIRAADHAMYEAKAGGRNCVRLASTLPRSSS
jgi:diguanylate cyclase (GGDEF)-like protein